MSYFQATNFDKMLQFVKNVVNGFNIGADGALFGAITFSTDAEIEFLLDDHVTQASLDNAILNSIAYKSRYMDHVHII